MASCRLLFLFTLCAAVYQCNGATSTSTSSTTSTTTTTTSTSDTTSTTSDIPTTTGITATTMSTTMSTATTSTTNPQTTTTMSTTTVTTTTTSTTITTTTTTTTTPTTTSTTTTTTAMTTTPTQKKIITIKGRGFQKKIVFHTGCIRSCYGQNPGLYPSCSGCDKVVICKPWVKKISRCYYRSKWDDRLKQCRNYSSTCRETVTYTPRRYSYYGNNYRNRGFSRFGWK